MHKGYAYQNSQFLLLTICFTRIQSSNMSLRVQELELENKTQIATNKELWKLEFKSWSLQTNTNSTKQEAQKTWVQELELENKTQIAPNKELWKLEFKSGSLQTNTNNTKQGSPKTWVQEVKLGNKTQRTPKKRSSKVITWLTFTCLI